MPVSYMFVPRAGSDNEPQPLAEVNDIICSYCGIEPDEKLCDPIFDRITDAGIGALLHCGGSEVKQEHVEHLMQVFVKAPMIQKLLRWVFLYQWRFSAWR